MYKLRVVSSIESYDVEVARDDLDFSSYDFVIADQYFESKLAPSNGIFIDANEENKNLKTVETICEQMRQAGVKRSSRIAALGGGVIQDLATLASSLFMRGVKWDYFPSTLTGMMDSCLGGKSSINLGSTKNLLGNIYPPSQIKILPSLAVTLPLEDMVSGYAEAVKICFAKGEDSFLDFLRLCDAYPPEMATNLDEIIFHSLKSKQWFIEKDEFDTKERQLLNFGHTFGHALEASSHYGIPHGVAVAVGVIAAVNHENSVKSKNADLLSDFMLTLLTPLSSVLSKVMDDLDWDVFEQALQNDKKNTREALCHILPGAGGTLIKAFIPYEQQAIEKATTALKTSIEMVRKINDSRD